MSEIKCPVCDKEMQATNTKLMFMCPVRRTRVKELKCVIESSHAMVLLNKDGQVIMKTLDIFPYSFEIHDNPNGLKQTRICQVRSEFDWSEEWERLTIGNKYMQRRELVVLPKALDIKWSNKKEVLSKVKMYMLFS
jgi:hypothetical protein